MDRREIAPSIRNRIQQVQLAQQRGNLPGPLPTSSPDPVFLDAMTNADATAEEDSAGRREEDIQDTDREISVNLHIRVQTDDSFEEAQHSHDYDDQQHQQSDHDMHTECISSSRERMHSEMLGAIGQMASALSTLRHWTCALTLSQPWERDMPPYHGVRPIPESVQSLRSILIGTDPENNYFKADGSLNVTKVKKDFVHKKTRKHLTNNFTHKSCHLKSGDELLDFWKDDRLFSEQQWLALLNGLKGWPPERFKFRYYQAKAAREEEAEGTPEQNGEAMIAQPDNGDQDGTGSGHAELAAVQSRTDEVSAKTREKTKASRSEQNHPTKEKVGDAVGDENDSTSSPSHILDDYVFVNVESDSEDDSPLRALTHQPQSGQQQQDGECEEPSQHVDDQHPSTDLSHLQQEFDEGKATKKAIKQSQKHKFGPDRLRGG